MNRFFVLMIFCLMAGGMTAQRTNGLYVHSYKGQVLYCPQDADEWQQPQIMQTVMRKDSLYIDTNSQVVLIDGANDNVYQCTIPRRDDILHLIQLANKKANSLLVSLSKQLLENVMGKSTHMMQMTYDSEPYIQFSERKKPFLLRPDSTARMALRTAAQYMQDGTMPDMGIHWRMNIEDGLAHLVFANAGSSAYCVNVLDLDVANNKVSLRVVPTPDVDGTALMLPPGKIMDLDMYCFLPNPSHQYILFATPEPYLPSAVQDILQQSNLNQ